MELLFYSVVLREREKAGVVMSSDETVEIASVEVDRDQLVEGLRLLGKHVKPQKTGRAFLRREGADLVVEIGGGEVRAEISGRWEGEARLNGRLLIDAVKRSPRFEPVTIRVEVGRLILNHMSIPCDWEATTAPHALIPIGASLLDILKAGKQHSDETLERAGQLDSVHDARKKRKRLIRKAVKILLPLKVTEEAIEAVVDRQLGDD